LRSRPGFDQGIPDEDIAYQLAEADLFRRCWP
jgi:hypothetical protein